MAPQVTINFNKLPVTFVVKRGMFQVKRNVQMVFTVRPRSMLTEFPLTNSMEPLRGLEKASRPASITNRSLTKKAIKNLKRYKCRSDKRRAKCSAPKLAPSPALELANITLRRAFQQRSFFAACPLMAMPRNPVCQFPTASPFQLRGESSQRKHQQTESQPYQVRLGFLT